MLHQLDELLNRTTMYRLILYVLCIIWTVAVILSVTSIIAYESLTIFLMTGWILLMCVVCNRLFAQLFSVSPNIESVYITGLILSLIVGPVSLEKNWLPLLITVVLAISSKYLLAPHKRHIFNPAGFGVLAAVFLFGEPASWWVGMIQLVPVLAIGGLLVLYKARRLTLALTFLGVYIASLVVTSGFGPAASSQIMTLLLYSPIIFFATIMLPEPVTSPVGRRDQMIYGVMVGVILVFLQKFVSGVPYSLEAALIGGNVVSYMLSPHFRTVLRFQKKVTLDHDIYGFYFERATELTYTPGQYLEWTLPHPNPDSRGIRRYFTIASAPIEPYVLLAVKMSNPASTFKHALSTMNTGDKIVISNPEGDFVLPKEKDGPVVCIAGGIGITPFRSMIADMLERGDRRKITVLYGAKTADDLVFTQLFDKAKKELGIKVIYTVSTPSKDWKGRVGRVDEQLIKEKVKEYKTARFFISGPQGMIDGFKQTLTSLGIPRHHIKTDFFPGYPPSDT